MGGLLALPLPSAPWQPAQLLACASPAASSPSAWAVHPVPKARIERAATNYAVDIGLGSQKTPPDDCKTCARTGYPRKPRINCPWRPD